jgi:hypothetical protein
MAGIRQIRANRQNSQSSPGSSEQGKFQSRVHALRYGIAAAELVFEADSDRIQLMASDWQPELKAEGPFGIL